MEHNGRIAYETIVAAKNGDTEAICEILRHYERYICHFAKRTVYDADGYPHSIIDDNRRKQIEAEYLSVLLLHYDPNRLPKGETLEQVNRPAILPKRSCTAGSAFTLASSLI